MDLKFENVVVFKVVILGYYEDIVVVIVFIFEMVFIFFVLDVMVGEVFIVGLDWVLIVCL